MRKDVLDPDRIIIPEGRDFDPDTVEKLKMSMAEVGLLNPISVQSLYEDGPRYLVAGRNRLEAVRQLGWDTIDVIVLPDGDTSPDLADLAEIAENLHRRDIGEIERAELLARWVEIVGKREADKIAQVGQFSKVGAGRGNKGGISQASRDLGLSRQQLTRATKIAALSPEEQVAEIEERAKRPTRRQSMAKVMAERAEKIAKKDADDLTELLEAWEAASPQARMDFLACIRIDEGGSQ